MHLKKAVDSIIGIKKAMKREYLKSKGKQFIITRKAKKVIFITRTKFVKSNLNKIFDLSQRHLVISIYSIYVYMHNNLNRLAYQSIHR